MSVGVCDGKSDGILDGSKDGNMVGNRVFNSSLYDGRSVGGELLKDSDGELVDEGDMLGELLGSCVVVGSVE
jgi:hypothetical protein